MLNKFKLNPQAWNSIINTWYIGSFTQDHLPRWRNQISQEKMWNKQKKPTEMCVTRQFYRLKVPRITFFWKKKKAFLDMVLGSMCTKFQVSIVFRWSGGETQSTHKKISQIYIWGFFISECVRLYV